MSRSLYSISEYLQLTHPSGDTTTAGTSITPPSPTTTRPKGDGIISMGGENQGGNPAGGEGQDCPNGLLLIPIGTGASTNTMVGAVFAWQCIRGAAPNTIDLWIAHTLLTFTATFGTLTGVAGTRVDNLHFFPGTITAAVGNANVDYAVTSPTGNTVGHLCIDCKGARLVQVSYALNASSTANNGLYKRIAKVANGQ
jgi:hypothetical protein